MITPASPPNAIIITKLSWPDIKGNFILITYIFSYMEYPEPGCFSQQLWLIGTHINPSALYEHKSQSRRPGHKTKRRRNESAAVSILTEFLPASMLPHQTTQKRSEVNQLQFWHAYWTLSHHFCFSQWKETRLKTSGAIPSDNFNISEIVSHLTLSWVVCFSFGSLTYI